MIIPKNLEELASYVESDQKVVFFFTADWCPDCQFIYPVMPEIEALHPDMTFVRVNPKFCRDSERSGIGTLGQ